MYRSTSVVIYTCDPVISGADFITLRHVSKRLQSCVTRRDLSVFRAYFSESDAIAERVSTPRQLVHAIELTTRSSIFEFFGSRGISELDRASRCHREHRFSRYLVMCIGDTFPWTSRQCPAKTERRQRVANRRWWVQLLPLHNRWFSACDDLTYAWLCVWKGMRNRECAMFGRGGRTGYGG